MATELKLDDRHGCGRSLNVYLLDGQLLSRMVAEVYDEKGQLLSQFTREATVRALSTTWPRQPSRRRSQTLLWVLDDFDFGARKPTGFKPRQQRVFDEMLDSLLRWQREGRLLSVEGTGHADPQSRLGRNQEASEVRALFVRAKLEEAKIEPQLLGRFVGFGATQPRKNRKCTVRNKEAHACERRVEIVATYWSD